MMQKMCKVTLNKEKFDANVGDVLLDGAIMSGVELQHDCRSESAAAAACVWSTARSSAAPRKAAT
jgi:hypothetical protein